MNRFSPMRSGRRNAALAGAAWLALVSVGGCDSGDAPPPPPPAAATPATQPEPAPRRPTTQQLTGGAWKTVPVSLLPLNISLPESWEVVPAANGGLLAVEGFSPAGFVQIRMSSRNSIPVDTFDGFVKSARTAAEANGDRLRKFDVKPGDPLTLIERQIAGDREPMPVTDDQGNIVEREATPLRWSILLFLKSGEKYETFEMQFDAMSLEHYQQDEAFLRRIVDGLAFDPSRQRG